MTAIITNIQSKSTTAAYLKTKECIEDVLRAHDQTVKFLDVSLLFENFKRELIKHQIKYLGNNAKFSILFFLRILVIFFSAR